MQYFLAEIDRFSTRDVQSNSYYPIIVCGDFNAQPQSPLSNFLIDGQIKYDAYRRTDISGQIPRSMSRHRFSPLLPSNELLPSVFVTSDCRFPSSTIPNDNYRTTAELTHNKQFHSVYDLDDRSTVSTCINNESQLVDYIFYTRQNNDRQRLKLVSRYDLYTDDHMRHVHLPNHQFASDHFLLAAKFALKLQTMKRRTKTKKRKQ
jgi:hypothetical protein